MYAVYAVGSTVYVGSYNDSSLYISTDGGVSFTGYPLGGFDVSGVIATGDKVYAAREGYDNPQFPQNLGGLSVGVG